MTGGDIFMIVGTIAPVVIIISLVKINSDNHTRRLLPPHSMTIRNVSLSSKPTFSSHLFLVIGLKRRPVTVSYIQNAIREAT